MEFTVGKLGYKQLSTVINQIIKDNCEERYINMREDIDGNKLSIGDTILICNANRYGSLARYKIIGETKMFWKIESLLERYKGGGLDKQNFNKDSSRILKCNG